MVSVYSSLALKNNKLKAKFCKSKKKQSKQKAIGATPLGKVTLLPAANNCQLLLG